MDRREARAADREWLQQVSSEVRAGQAERGTRVEQYGVHAFEGDYREEADAVTREVAHAVAQREFRDRQLHLLRQVRQRELQRMRARAKREASITGRLLSALFGDREG